MTTERVIGGIYKITEKLGEGGMGEVFKGFDTMLEREVAIKSLRPELCSRPDVVERFRNEAVALGRMNQQNIATVYSFLKDNEQWFLVLEFVRGETLDKLLERRGALPWREALKIICQALEGLEHAHRLGVVHRDIKPANMIFTPAGGLKLMDFGIARLLERARLTRTGHLIGTLEYMSPEQVQGKDSDAQGDIYSIGIVLYELLTGRVPFQKDSDYALIRAQVEEQPTPPTVFLPHLPKDLEGIVLTALQKNPTQRYASAAAFQADLQGLLSTASANTNEKQRTAAPETRFDIRNTGLTGDRQRPSNPQSHKTDDAKPALLAGFHDDKLKANVKTDITSIEKEDGNTDLTTTWQRYRPWVVMASVLFVTMGVIFSLLLLQNETEPAPMAENIPSIQLPEKLDVKAEPAAAPTIAPVRQPKVGSEPATIQTYIPKQVEPSEIGTIDDEQLNPPAIKEAERARNNEIVRDKPKKQKRIARNNNPPKLTQKKQQQKKIWVSRNNSAQQIQQPQRPAPDNNWVNEIHPVQVK